MGLANITKIHGTHEILKDSIQTLHFKNIQQSHYREVTVTIARLLLLVIRSLISSAITSFAAVNNSYFPSLLPEGL